MWLDQRRRGNARNLFTSVPKVSARIAPFVVLSVLYSEKVLEEPYSIGQWLSLSRIPILV